jgi:hypothetical protein
LEYRPGNRQSWQAFCGFPLYIHPNAGIIFQLFHDRFVLNPSQFIIIHLSSYHPMLYSFDVERFVKSPTRKRSLGQVIMLTISNKVAYVSGRVIRCKVVNNYWLLYLTVYVYVCFRSTTVGTSLRERRWRSHLAAATREVLAEDTHEGNNCREQTGNKYESTAQ